MLVLSIILKGCTILGWHFITFIQQQCEYIVIITKTEHKNHSDVYDEVVCNCKALLAETSMMVVSSDYSSYSTAVSIVTFFQQLSALFLCLDTLKRTFSCSKVTFRLLHKFN